MWAPLRMDKRGNNWLQVWKEPTAALKGNEDDSAKLGVLGGGGGGRRPDTQPQIVLKPFSSSSGTALTSTLLCSIALSSAVMRPR